MTQPQIALVTGASKGIGRATVIRLAEDGFDIWLNYRSDHAAAQTVADRVRAIGRQCLPLAFDVTDAAECKNVLAPLLEEQTPYALVNNAGFAKDGIMAMMSEKNWRSVLDVHLQGFFNVTSIALPKMLRRREGRIVNMASASGLAGIGGQVNYSAAKAGLIGATRSLAVEIAKRNVLVNAVAPGFIDTEMLAGHPVDKIEPTIPMQRIGIPKEVAAVVSFLCSQDASYITGQVISVNGGIFTG
ncbi:MAG: 3-oxoacyl-ACP reductase FabG [Desulfovibrio sp.]|jgi:3-oxoacyl-[acyl-carrier protein] reductase|nr:3-oxoacyl-ACP reductase FabG [Desulfovibrio sp.]